jgi:hypothetical protein
VPSVIFLGGLVASVVGFPVGLVRLGVVCAVPIAIGPFSIDLRKINIERAWDGEQPATQVKQPMKWSANKLGLIMRAGDAIAVRLMAIAWLAVVRATISVVLLAATESIDFNGFALALLVVACAGIILTWPTASYLWSA